MKKILIAVAVLLLLNISAFAAADSKNRLSPWEDENIHIYVGETFTDFADGEIDGTKEPFWSMAVNNAASQNKTVPFPFLCKWEGGRFVIYGNDEDENTFNISDVVRIQTQELSGSLNVQKTAAGMGVYIENNTATEQVLDFYMIGAGCYSVPEGDPLYLADLEGTITRADNGGGVAMIPAGFKGYLYCFLEDIEDLWKDKAAWDPAIGAINYPGFNFISMAVEEGETFVMDNVFFFGQEVEENNDGIIKVTVNNNTPQTSSSAEPTQSGGDPTAVADKATVLQPGTNSAGLPVWVFVLMGAMFLLVAAFMIYVWIQLKKIRSNHQ